MFGVKNAGVGAKSLDVGVRIGKFDAFHVKLAVDCRSFGTRRAKVAVKSITIGAKCSKVGANCGKDEAQSGIFAVNFDKLLGLVVIAADFL